MCYCYIWVYYIFYNIDYTLYCSTGEEVNAKALIIPEEGWYGTRVITKPIPYINIFIQKMFLFWLLGFSLIFCIFTIF